MGGFLLIDTSDKSLVTNDSYEYGSKLATPIIGLVILNMG